MGPAKNDNLQEEDEALYRAVARGGSNLALPSDEGAARTLLKVAEKPTDEVAQSVDNWLTLAPGR